MRQDILLLAAWNPSAPTRFVLADERHLADADTLMRTAQGGLAQRKGAVLAETKRK